MSSDVHVSLAAWVRRLADAPLDCAHPRSFRRGILLSTKPPSSSRPVEASGTWAGDEPQLFSQRERQYGDRFAEPREVHLAVETVRIESILRDLVVQEHADLRRERAVVDVDYR